MGACCNIHLLGGLRVQLGDQEITRFRSQKFAALLAYLAYPPQRAYTREHLAELLWPNEEPQVGRNNLRVALSSLRRQLEPPGIPAGAVLQADRSTVRLNPELVWTDIAEFETLLRAAGQAQADRERVGYLERAVELYSGELLAGQYEDWIPSEQARLSDLFFSAASQLTRIWSAGEEPERAIQLAHRMVRLDPLREEAYRELIRLYTAAGQPGAALRQYRELERLLATELGAAPSDLTRRLAREVAAGKQPEAHPEERTARPLPVPRVPVARRVQDRRNLTVPDTLPVTFTRFFGRTQELRRLEELLASPEARLVTITGPGGTGKTRVAIEAARRLRAAQRVDVWFVSLAEAADIQHLVTSVRDALRLSRANADAVGQITSALAHRPALLVLDNFEQLLPAGASLPQLLLEGAPQLKCLITSRQRLDLHSEHELALAPLPVPEPAAALEELAACESVQLFVSRAQAVRPDFQVTPQNAAGIAALCGRLEGIPLALELAAARTTVLSLGQMLANLDHRLEFLTSR
ncbi:MAG TPA: BTAD domain-containing putative transcriptional regulator, partial [Armatimonadota bacterium]|nr:BTAD domain-containing putative transcriptional regulator [Armatimonadota bacterium]